MILKVLIISGIIFLNIQFSYGAVTVEQMKSASKMMRDVCQPKFKLSDDVANGISKGNIPDDKQVKCYINCILEMAQIVKKGKFIYDSIMKQIEVMVPDELKADYTKGANACLHAGDGVKNVCEVSYLTLKCLTSNVPTFLFP